MHDNKIHPVVLSGGMGTRLWPMSRINQPKQFQPVDGNGGPSFLQDTVLRHSGALYHPPLIVAGAGERGLIAEQLGEIGVAADILGEPVGRNTGPAVLAAALLLARSAPDALMLVLPSDHKIEGDLNAVIDGARPAAQEGRIVLFGIVPQHPETGFGYITCGEPLPGHDTVRQVARFVEKPDLEAAQRMIDEGGTYWASGISLMRADVLIREFSRHAPQTLEAVRDALTAAAVVENGLVLDEAAFAEAENQPTERLVFERTDRVVVAETDVDWNDVGAWTAVHSIGEKTGDGNVSTGEVVSIETRNSLIRAGDRLVTVIGMEDVIVVDTPDALLVTNHAHAQKVKDAVNWLKADNRSEVLGHPDRPARGNVETHDIAAGGRLDVTGGAPGGAIVAVASGEALIIDGPLTGARDEGTHLSVRPDQTMRVENTGAAVLRVVVIDLSPRDAVHPTTATAGSEAARA